MSAPAGHHPAVPLTHNHGNHSPQHGFAPPQNPMQYNFAGPLPPIPFPQAVPIDPNLDQHHQAPVPPGLPPAQVPIVNHAPGDHGVNGGLEPQR